MKTQSKIHLILTGGTIDSYYNSLLETVVPDKHSVIPDYLKKLKLYINLKFTEVCMKDSRSLTKQDLKRTLKEIEKSPCKMVIITHGTYTMPDTARYLKSNLKRKDQKIILTGSMLPLKGVDFTDASFNLGYASANVQRCDNGIYLCMNGFLFTPDEVAKNILEGRFYSVLKNKQ
jgi:L-asparaginase